MIMIHSTPLMKRVQFTLHSPILSIMKRTMTLALLTAMSLTAAQAQINEQELQRAQEEAARAQKAAQAAAAKAEEQRKKIMENREPVMSEEVIRIAEAQERQRKLAREKRERKARKADAGGDSVWWANNQMKMQTWKRNWFVGAQIAPNFLVADNVTDHKLFKYAGDALGLGVNVYAGKYLSNRVALRLNLGYHNAKNRVDYETVDAWKLYQIHDGHGYYRNDVWEVGADALFDIGGTSRAVKFYPLHVHAVVGVDMLATGEKELVDGMVEKKYYTVTDKDGNERQVENYRVYYDEKREREQYEIWYVDDNGNVRQSEFHEMFETRVSKKARVNMALRLGLLLDYRVSKNLSINLEPTVSIVDDWFDGIKYAEPIDVFIRLNAGLTYHF